MKNKKHFIILLLLFSCSCVFAAGDGQDLLDTPLYNAITYFGGVLSYFIGFATKYAVVIGTIGLCWSCFRLINSRINVKDFWWDTFYKWVLYLILITAYVPVTNGLIGIASQMGVGASGGISNFQASLNKMQTYVTKFKEDNSATFKEKVTSFMKNDLELSIDTNHIEENYLTYVIETSNLKEKEKKKAVKELKKMYKEYNELGTAKTIAAMEDLFSSTKGGTYITSNIYIKSNTIMLSPAAVLRISTMVAHMQFLMDQLRLNSALELVEGQDLEWGFISKPIQQVGIYVQHIPETLITLFCCLCLLICTCIGLVQYMVTVIEYTAIVGIGAFFIPFILFDGTKDLPKKLVPVFVNLFIRIIVITICTLFSLWLYLKLGENALTDSSGAILERTAETLLSTILALVLCLNSPKIAATLCTGQPQLGFGDIVAVAGGMKASAMLGKTLAKKGKEYAGKKIDQGIDKGVQKYAQTKKDYSAVNQARMLSQQNGLSKSQTLKNMATSLAQSRGTTMISGIKTKLNKEQENEHKRYGRETRSQYVQRMNEKGATIAKNRVEKEISKNKNENG